MVKHREVHNGLDIIDSRDVIARIEELESERADLVEQAEASRKAGDGSDSLLADIETLDEELKPLKALAEEGGNSADWPHGEAIIRDSYFETYARDLADNIGAIDKNATWPANCIDWDAAVELLQNDYFSVDYDGVTYWIRS